MSGNSRLVKTPLQDWFRDTEKNITGENSPNLTR